MPFSHTVLCTTVLKQHLSSPQTPLAMDLWVILEGLHLLPAQDGEREVLDRTKAAQNQRAMIKIDDRFR